MGKEWDANTIGRVFGIIDEALYSMALYSEINPSNRDNAIFDPYLRKFWKTISAQPGASRSQAAFAILSSGWRSEILKIGKALRSRISRRIPS